MAVSPVKRPPLVDVVCVINDNLQQQLKLLYDYWFTQFDFPDESGKPYKSSGGLMLSNDKVSYKVPADWTVCSLFENPLTTIIKPGIDVFESKNYLATAEVNGTDISTGAVINYETRESRANMQPTVNSVWFAKMKNSVKHLFEQGNAGTHYQLYIINRFLRITVH